MTALPPGNVLDRIAAGRSWTDEERMILDQLRRVADETIAPNAARYDEAGAFPRDSVAALDALGLNAVFVPEAYGGAPTRYRHYLECVSVVSEACASTGIVFATNYHATGPVIDHGTEAQKSRLLPRVAAGAVASLAITEPSAGSDALGMKTRFAPDGDEIVIDGGKIFITSGDVADLVLLFGMWDGVDDPREAISAVVVEKGAPGFEALDERIYGATALRILRRRDPDGGRAGGR